ncbi:MAG TPA: hypothetical protein VGP25_08625 [Gemmatimonadaceae bacterium]|jgi:hypothetical protein|nr:hypothetical protein [Gemmatimonadaceae bacterium]
MKTNLRLSAIALLALFAACESDEDKTSRLRDGAQSDCLTVSAHEANPQSPAPTDAEKATCEKARNDYNTFLDGR